MSIENVTADVQAALTVAVVASPQAIAYALLAGIPPAHDLATRPRGSKHRR